MSQNLSSAAVVIGALRVKPFSYRTSKGQCLDINPGERTVIDKPDFTVGAFYGAICYPLPSKVDHLLM